jgi:hypothetical protein
MLTGRLARNRRHLGRWARREGIGCWRVYDRDIPELPVTIDTYEGRTVGADRRSAGLVAVRPEQSEQPVAADRRARRARNDRQQRDAPLLRCAANQRFVRTREADRPEELKAVQHDGTGVSATDDNWTIASS